MWTKCVIFGHYQVSPLKKKIDAEIWQDETVSQKPNITRKMQGEGAKRTDGMGSNQVISHFCYGGLYPKISVYHPKRHAINFYESHCSRLWNNKTDLLCALSTFLGMLFW